MKKLFFFITVIATVYTTNAQTRSYNDIGVLFAQEQISGTARFNSMSGAFGALGGDISAVGTNPAGAAVFLKNEASFTVDFRGVDTDANYYGTTTYSNQDEVNFSQSGGVFIIKNNYSNANNSGWGRVAFAFDYSKVNDFKNFWFAEGNSDYPTWVNDPNDDNQFYYNSDGQHLENYTDGRNNKYALTIASQYNNNIFIGATFNSYDIDYYQHVLIEEYNYDANNGDYLNASMFQELSTYGYGYSFNLGIIGKVTDNLRLGFAYQSPVWYDLEELYLAYDEEIYVSNVDEVYSDYSGISNYYYNLRTPSRYTGSAAYIFGKLGLISIDYIYKDYSNIELSGGPFSDENQAFDRYLNGVSEVRIGTEWRFENLSIRGGYHFEQSPYKDAISSDDREGYSFGLGYNFGPAKIDFSYLYSSRTTAYDFYPEYPEVNPVELNFDSSRYTVTLILNM